MSESKLIVNYFASGIIMGALIMISTIYNVGPTNFVNYGQKKIFVLLGIFLSCVILYNEALKENKNMLVLCVVIAVLVLTIIQIITIGL